MDRTEIINKIIKKVNAKHYLEIGISNGDNFNKIICENKVGVDPDPSVKCTHNITSDEFFENNSQIFDVIFIDGLHRADQVEKDILNSLSCLSSNGYIICHDINPTTELMQLIPQQTQAWTGDCWRAWVKLRQEKDDICMFVINTDYGCGIITNGRQEPLKITEEINYNNFEKYKKEWLNLIEIEELSTW